MLVLDEEGYRASLEWKRQREQSQREKQQEAEELKRLDSPKTPWLKRIQQDAEKYMLADLYSIVLLSQQNRTLQKIQY